MQAKNAAALIPGIVAMLIVAGIIEGYFTPLPVDPWLKLAFAALTGVGLFAYFTKGINKTKIENKKQTQEFLTDKGEN